MFKKRFKSTRSQFKINEKIYYRYKFYIYNINQLFKQHFYRSENYSTLYEYSTAQTYYICISNIKKDTYIFISIHP